MILFHAAEDSRVVESLKALLAGLQVKQCRSIKALANCLRKPCHGLEIGLLVVNNSEEMLQILGLQDLIRDLRLVLVLPGRDPKMVVMAHKLSPRFIAYADNGYDQIGAVLGKMVGTSNKKKTNTTIPFVHHKSKRKGKGIELKG